jgi:hypothetical protein
MPPVRTAASLPVPGHVIRVGGAIALFPLLRERGIDPEALAAEAGLSAGVFANPDNVVPFVALCRLAHLARERTGLCDVGLRACTNAGLAALGLLGRLVANSESVGRGLAALQEFLHVHDVGATAYFASEGDLAVLDYEVLTPGVRGADQVTFGALAIAANVLRGLCGAGFRERARHELQRAAGRGALPRRQKPVAEFPGVRRGNCLETRLFGYRHLHACVPPMGRHITCPVASHPDDDLTHAFSALGCVLLAAR